MDQGERPQPKESEVQSESRSENYMARFLTQTIEAFDTAKPFSLGSPEPLTVTADKLKILDRYTLDYATRYWTQDERKAMTHDQKLQDFASKWSNAIIKRYGLPKEGEAIDQSELDNRKKRSEVLRKLGLDPENMSADAVRKYHEENFGKGRDVNAFIGRVRQSLSPEEMRAHLDDIEFVARMFDRETAKDIRAVIELGLEQNIDAYAKRSNSQQHVRSDGEKRRLRELSKYLKPKATEDEAVKVDIQADAPLKVDIADGTDEKAGKKSEVIDIDIPEEDKPAEPVLEIDIPGASGPDVGGGDKDDGIEIVEPKAPVVADDLDVIEVEANIPTKEFPKEAKLYGTEGDNMRIVISEPVLVQINKLLKDMSWEDGDFKEKGAVFIGKKYKDTDGRIWTDVIGAFPLLQTKSTWGSIRFTPDSWVEANNVIDHFVNVDKDGNRRPNEDQLEMLGWIHSHPKNWEGVMSAQDDQPAIQFSFPWQFAYIYAAGLGKDTPVDINQVQEDQIGKLFAFFSTGGEGTKFGPYNKHHGFYTRPKTDRDKAYGTGDALPNGKAVDDLIKKLDIIVV